MAGGRLWCGLVQQVSAAVELKLGPLFMCGAAFQLKPRVAGLFEGFNPCVVEGILCPDFPSPVRRPSILYVDFKLRDRGSTHVQRALPSLSFETSTFPVSAQ